MCSQKIYPPFVKTLVSVAVASMFVVGVAHAAEVPEYEKKSFDSVGKTHTGNSSPYNVGNNQFEVAGALFGGNSSTGNGGALVVGTSGKVNISETSFEYNTATKGGGAIMTNGGQGTFYKTDFIGNKATGSWDGGGAIKFSQASGKYSIDECDFESNSAPDLGGAIYAVGKRNIELEITDSNFTSNSGLRGGAIASETGSTLTFIGTNKFEGNTSNNNGGAIYNSSGTISFEGTTIFTNNLNKTTPNDIYNQGGTINIVKGGAVVLDGGISGNGNLNIAKGGSLLFVIDAKSTTAQSTDYALLSIDKSFNVTGVINVGDISELAARASGPQLNLGNGSMLQLDGSMSGAALTANKGTLTIADGAMLSITNISKVGEFTLASGFTLNGEAWSNENTSFSNVMFELDGITQNENGDLVLLIGAKEAASVFPRLISNNSIDALMAAGLNDESVDAPIGVQMLRTILTSDAESPVIDVVNEVSSSAVVIGVQNTALRLSDTASNTILDRMSLAQRVESEGVNLWAVPMYGNLYSSDMVTSGASVRGQFGGVAIGADFGVGDLLGGKYRLGASFNVGGGQSKSKGTVISAKNNFDFGGVNVYGVWTKGAFNVIGSLGYGYGNHELALGLPMAGFASADGDVDTKALTADLRAEYLVKTDVMDILPHVGVRYTALKTDAHDLMVGGDVLNSVKADTQYIVQFPIGVTLSKDLACSDWAVKPMIDLSVIPAIGDKHSTTMVNFSGVNAWDNVSARVLDRTSWTGTLGVQAQKGNFTLSMNYGVQHASNETDQSVQVKLNWMF